MLVEDLLEHLGTFGLWQWVASVIGLILVFDAVLATTVLTHYWRTEIKSHRNKPTHHP